MPYPSQNPFKILKIARQAQNNGLVNKLSYKSEQEAIISEMARRSALKRENSFKEKFEAWETKLSDEERTKVCATFPPVLMVLEKTYGFSHPDVRDCYHTFFVKNVKE